MLLPAGLYFVGYLAQIPASVACVALGARRFLALTLFVWGAVAMCFAAIKGKAGFLVLRLLLGFAGQSISHHSPLSSSHPIPCAPC